MWSFHLSSLDLSVELVQLKDEKVFFSFRRPKLENLIIVPAGDLLMLRHANWLVLFPVHLALASIWLWLWSFVSYQALLTRKIRILVGQKWSYSRITKPKPEWHKIQMDMVQYSSICMSEYQQICCWNNNKIFKLCLAEGIENLFFFRLHLLY